MRVYEFAELFADEAVYLDGVSEHGALVLKLRHDGRFDAYEADSGTKFIVGPDPGSPLPWHLPQVIRC